MNALIEGFQMIINAFSALIEFLWSWVEGATFILTHMGDFITIARDSVAYMPDFLIPYLSVGVSLIITFAVIKLL